MLEGFHQEKNHIKKYVEHWLMVGGNFMQIEKGKYKIFSTRITTQKEIKYN